MRRRVAAVPGQPLPNGILGPCPTIIDVPPDDPDRGHELLGVDWQPLSCCDAHCWTDPCDEESPGESPGQSPGEPGEKLFCRPGWQSAPPVTIYSAVECATTGWTYNEAVEQARAALQLGQQRALEQFVWTQILTAMAVDRTPPGGPVSIPAAVGILEGWLGVDYGGLGVLHVPTAGGALLSAQSQLRREGNRLRTAAVGNCVILGAGYGVNTGPGGMPAPPGTVWLAASGPVTVRREAVQLIPDTDREAINITTNDRQVLAERTFVVQVSCTVHMVLANMSCCC